MSRSNIKKNTFVVLILFFVLAVCIRLIHFKEITFFYDQARDAFESINILQNKDIKIVGPSTDIQGLHHGPLYWYILSPIYYLSNGNVYLVRLFLIILGSLGTFLIYFLAKIFTKDTKVAMLSAFLVATSFEATQYSRWMSNPSPAFLTIPIFWLGLWLIYKNNRLGLPLALLGLFVSMQFQLFLLYLTLFLVLLLIFKFIKKQFDNIFVFDKQTNLIYFLSLLFLSTFVVAEIKFKFLGATSLINHFVQKSANVTNYEDRINIFISSIIQNVQNNFSINASSAIVLLTMLIFSSVYLYIKNRNIRPMLVFLWVWFLSPLIVHLLNGYFAYFVNIGNSFPLIILTTYLLSQLLIIAKFEPLIYIVVLIFAFLNIQKIVSTNMNGETLFAIQDKMIVTDEQKTIDWVYEDAHGKNFAFNSVTNPLFINTTWAYMFNWYGNTKYHYLPAWWGYPQNDQPGFSVPFVNKNIIVGDNLYLIIEPSGGIPDSYPKAYRTIEDCRSKVIEVKKIGNITIEKRKILNFNSFSRDDLMKVILK